MCVFCCFDSVHCFFGFDLFLLASSNSNREVISEYDALPFFEVLCLFSVRINTIQNDFICCLHLVLHSASLCAISLLLFLLLLN